jgi:hypothetical protein
MNYAALTYDPVTESRPNPFRDPSPLNGASGRTKVALIGFEEQNGRTGPYDDPDYDLWTFNMANRLGFMHDTHGRFRCDRWFDLHQPHAQSEKDLAWINTCPVPIYLTEQFGTNHLAQVLDLIEIEQRIWARYGRMISCTYFASSFAYALALAISEGYQTIGLYGVSLDWGRERVVERGNLEYWIGIAEGLGVAVEIGTTSKLLTHPGLYGIQYDTERDGVIRICAELIRQLLQSKIVQEEFDAGLQARLAALEEIQRYCAIAVQRLIYQSPVTRS